MPLTQYQERHKMRVKMLMTISGVEDGKIHPTMFFKGREYDLCASLVEPFVAVGAIEITGEEKEFVEENKVVNPDYSKKRRGRPKKCDIA